MMMKRIAAAPIDEIDIGINEVVAVVLERLRPGFSSRSAMRRPG